MGTNIHKSIVMKIGTLIFNTIVVLSFCFLEEIYAARGPCTAPGLLNCTCADGGTIIICSEKGFTEIPSPLPAITVTLQFDTNKVSRIENGAFSNYPNMRKIDIGINQISWIDSGAFSGLQSLTTLYLDQNRISSIQPGTFTGLTSLKDLEMHNNNLTTVSANMFDRVTLLNSLLLNKNPLLCCTMVDFFEWIPNQRSLRTLFGTCHDYNTQTDINSFDVSKCPVDGQWGSWSTGPCSVTCGQGFINRNRSCDSPSPFNNGTDCIGSSTDSLSCTLAGCPVDGQWGSWSTGPCSVTCGQGLINRNRTCDSPPASNNGTACIGSSTESLSCTLAGCPVDGQWGSWSIGPCSVTCGQGLINRNRTCDSPPASNNGTECIGSSTDSLSCTLAGCPVDGQWGSWSTGHCSVTCGHGIRYRNRNCDSPPASNNGTDCIGCSIDSLSCTLAGCPKSYGKYGREA
ncbi:Hypothetical predicted protein, partial [Mytilus galloprovincialis]